MVEAGGYLFLVSLLLTLAFTPACIALGRRWQVLDIPGGRKIHHEPTPLTGGWAIFSALTVVIWGHLSVALLVRGISAVQWLPEAFRHFIELSPSLVMKVLPVYLGALAVFVLGLVDDVRGMSVQNRLVVQVALAGALVLAGIRPSLGFLPTWLASLVGILWIVGIMNSFNFLDGLDGLSAGVALIATAGLLAVVARGNQPVVAAQIAILAGVQLGFLCSNWHPAKAFLGSSGSLLLGYLVAVSALLVTYIAGEPGNWLMPLLTPFFLLAIPIYDTTSVVLIRLLKRRSIAIGDQSHFHHRLIRIGFSHKQAVVFICLISFSIAMSSVLLVRASLRESLLIVVQIAGIFSILVIAERVAQKVRMDILDRQRLRASLREQEAQEAKSVP